MTKKNKKILKKEISEIIKSTDEERAADIIYMIKIIKEKEGENGFNSLLEELKNYNFKLPNTEKLAPLKWFPRSLPSILLIVAIYFFNWKEEDIFEMGRKFISNSKPTRIFIKWLSSTKSTITRIAKDWNNYYTKGIASIEEFNKNDRFATLNLKDFYIHPSSVAYFEGMFAKILEISTGSKKIKVKEIENKDNYTFHKFRAKW